MKYVLAFLLGVACGAAVLVAMSCIVVGKMAYEDQILMKIIERKNNETQEESVPPGSGGQVHPEAQ